MPRARARHSRIARGAARHTGKSLSKENVMHGRNRVRYLASLAITVMAVCAEGCATAPPSRTETPAIAELRADYFKEFPDATNNSHVRHGEIVKGMSLYEVLASWGVPDRRLVTDTGHERWVYVLQDDLSMDWVAYEYDFRNNALVDWATARSNTNGFALDSNDEHVSAMSLPSWTGANQHGGAPTR
jgi:hypothetical protein